MTEETGASAQPTFGRVLLTLWAAYFVAPLLLLFVLFMIVPESPGEFAFAAAGSPFQLLAWVFLGIAVLCAVTALVMRPRMLRGPATGVRTHPSAEGRVRSAWIVSVACIEAGVLMGFVLAVMCGNVLNAAPFYLIWLPMMIWNMPTAARRDSWLIAAGDPDAVAAAPSGPIIR